MRVSTDSMIKRGIYTKNLYVWKGSIPLKDVDFTNIDTESEIDGYCDEGYCFI